MTDDTRPEARAVLLEGYRKMTPTQKLQRVADLNDAVRALALAGLRARHGPLSDRERDRRLADLLLGPALARRAFGGD